VISPGGLAKRYRLDRTISYLQIEQRSVTHLSLPLVQPPVLGPEGPLVRDLVHRDAACVPSTQGLVPESESSLGYKCNLLEPGLGTWDTCSVPVYQVTDPPVQGACDLGERSF